MRPKFTERSERKFDGRINPHTKNFGVGIRGKLNTGSGSGLRNGPAMKACLVMKVHNVKLGAAIRFRAARIEEWVKKREKRGRNSYKVLL